MVSFITSLLASAYLSAPVPQCVNCLIAAFMGIGQVAKGGLTPLNAVAGAATVPFALSLSDDFRTRNMSFVHPAENEMVTVGQTYELITKNYGYVNLTQPFFAFPFTHGGPLLVERL
jgi:hypothetical protein